MLSSALLAVVVAAGPAVVVDRVVAVVDGNAVLLSEVRAVQQVKDEDEPTAVESLIDELVMFAEASRLSQAALTDVEEQNALASLRARHPAIADVEALRRMARRQATILKYVDFRFRPQVQRADDAAAELDRRIESWVADLRQAAAVRYNAGGR